MREGELEDTLAGATGTSASLGELLVLFAALIGGQLVGIVVLWLWLPEIIQALLRAQPKAFWFLSRSAGAVAYVLASVVTATGLLLSTKQARRWPGVQVALELHRFASVLTVLLSGFHMVILLGDQWAKYTPWDLTIPFAAEQHRPFWVGLGQLSFYGLLILYLSFWLRRWLGTRGWRLLHYASFVIFVAVTLHGLFAGSDTLWLLPLYEVAGGIVAFGVVMRLLIRLEGAVAA